MKQRLVSKWKVDMVHVARDTVANELSLADFCLLNFICLWAPRNISFCNLFFMEQSQTLLSAPSLFLKIPQRLNLNVIVRAMNQEEKGREKMGKGKENMWWRVTWTFYCKGNSKVGSYFLYSLNLQIHVNLIQWFYCHGIVSLSLWEKWDEKSFTTFSLGFRIA